MGFGNWKVYYKIWSLKGDNPIAKVGTAETSLKEENPIAEEDSLHFSPDGGDVFDVEMQHQVIKTPQKQTNSEFPFKSDTMKKCPRW